MKQLSTLLQSKYPAIIWTIIIFILCTMPSKHIPGQTNDKMNHFIAFAGFTFFWLFRSQRVWLIIVLAAVYGIAIEFWQGILPLNFHRGFDWYDAVADTIGGIIGYFIWLIFNQLSKMITEK